MKTTKLIVFFALSLSLTIMSACKKDNDPAPVFETEYPLDTYLTKAGFTEITVNNGGETFYEFGYSFIPQVNGKIDSIKLAIPANMENVRVTLWEKENKEVVATWIVGNVWIDAPVSHSVASTPLTKGVEYMITVNSTAWFMHKRKDETDAKYPIFAGSVNITGYASGLGTEQKMPENEGFNRYSGDVGFYFIQTN